MMIVDLRKLKPNPMRDFTVDPIDTENVAKLKQSIQEQGFWGGIVCRRLKDGTIQIGAGHHRVEAAIDAGIRTADVFVSENMDDANMIRVYSLENSTQRGNTGTAQAGSVAAAIRFVAKELMTGGSGKLDITCLDFDAAQGNMTSDKGIGRSILLSILEGIPGINDASVRQQLAILKASGDYARIIGEVKEKIDEENREALKALQKAEQEKREAEERERKAEAARKEAAQKAKEAREDAERKRAELARQKAEAEAKLAEKRRQEAEAEMKKFDALRKTRDTATKAVHMAKTEAVKDKEGNPTGERKERVNTFDFEGVAKHMKNAHQIDVFRECVTGQGIAPYLPVKKQAELAKALVDLAKKTERGELSGAFIRTNITSLVLGVKREEKKLSDEDKRRLINEDFIRKAKHYQDEFSRHCRGLFAAANELTALHKEWPKGLGFPITQEFRNNLKFADNAITTIKRRVL